MTRKLDEIADAALELTRGARAALAKRLLDSLDEPTADEVGEGWIAEAERRYQELKAGRARTVASQDVLARLAHRKVK
jgi:putative addiction module component (TIGR02574 family)